MLPFRTVVFPTDFSAPAQAALAAAVEVARHFTAALHLVHVVPALPATTSDPNFTFSVPEYEALLHAEARDKLEQLATALRGEGLSCDWSIGNGNAGREIVRIAGERGADLIVIATHGETGWRHVIFGSVAERVVQHAPCPVLTIRSSDQA